jgi:hypothetical protein
MQQLMRARVERLSDFFGLDAGAELLSSNDPELDLPAPIAEHLERFNLEWHVIPSEGVLPFDDAYIERFYSMRARGFALPRRDKPSYRDALAHGHRRHQGQILAVEVTRKPRYLPKNQQYYGTPYGYDETADPLAPYLGRFTTATRYTHNYLSLRKLVTAINDDWRARGLMPSGYRLTICPPAVMNLVGTIFHPEWSDTESLELGFYRDASGCATCYAVGSNGPGDYSYIREIDGESDWALLGFRTVLVPDSI